MFASIFGVDVDPPEVKESSSQLDSQAPPASEAAKTSSNVGFDLWGVAAAVSKTFKERADELVKSVNETDWQSELTSFSKGVSDDTQTLTHKTAEFVEHLPEAVEQLPAKATAVNVGDVLTQFGQSFLLGTKELIEQVRDGIEEEISAAAKANKRGNRPAKTASASTAAAQPKYSRLDAEITAMQRDSNTYLDEPEDEEDFESWQSAFSLEGVQEDIDKLLAANAFMAELHSRIVPDIVERGDFWTRYFYRLHKLQQKEEQRAQLTQRAQAMSHQEEDEEGWDDLDVEDGSNPGAAAPGAVLGVANQADVDVTGEAGAALEPPSSRTGGAASKVSDDSSAPQPALACTSDSRAEQVHGSSLQPAATSASATTAAAAAVEEGHDEPAPLSTSHVERHSEPKQAATTQQQPVISINHDVDAAVGSGQDDDEWASVAVDEDEQEVTEMASTAAAAELPVVGPMEGPAKPVGGDSCTVVADEDTRPLAGGATDGAGTERERKDASTSSEEKRKEAEGKPAGPGLKNEVKPAKVEELDDDLDWGNCD